MFWYPQVKTTMLRAYILLASVVTTMALHGNYIDRFQMHMLKKMTKNMCCSVNSQDLYRNIYIVNIQAISIIWLMLGWIWRPHQNGSCVHLQQVINNCSLINIIKYITMIELNVKMKKKGFNLSLFKYIWMQHIYTFW